MVRLNVTFEQLFEFEGSLMKGQSSQCNGASTEQWAGKVKVCGACEYLKMCTFAYFCVPSIFRAERNM